MIAVIFEVWPKAHHRQDYFDIAAKLRPDLDGIDGFISVERFESLMQPARSCPCRSGGTRRRSPTGAGSPITARLNRRAAR